MAGAGDVNGDGIDDVIVGAHVSNLRTDELPGTGYVVFGDWQTDEDGVIEADLLFGPQGFQMPGLDPGDKTGFSVAAAGDVNGDRFDDIIIGAYAAENLDRPGFGRDAGAAYIVFGGPALGRSGPMALGDLDGINGFVLKGELFIDGTGFSVSGAGDVNGDGLADLIVGAPFAFGDSPIFGAGFGGECYILFGQVGLGAGGAIRVVDLDGSNGFVIGGVKEVGYLGYAVSGAGDINGDGLADLLIGESGNGQMLELAGTAYVIFGHPDLGSTGSISLPDLDGTTGFAIDGLVATDSLGRHVAGIGDFNQDGYDDIAVSTDYQVLVIFGGPNVGSGGRISPNDLNGANGFTIQSISPGGVFINDVSQAGDVNGDGISDLLIGSAGANQGRGEAYVIFGRRAPTDCNSNGQIDQCENIDSPTADCNANGIPDECLLAEEDCNTNGIPDACDIANGSSLDCNLNGIPDECMHLESDCNANGIPDRCDTTIGGSPDCNNNRIPDECIELEADCNSNGIPDACDTASGFSPDCNGNGIPDECLTWEFDCNNNGTPDECDLAAGTSLDCNTNGWPDECDLARQTSLDCNSNSVPDECEITGAEGNDCNSNRIPDDCEAGWNDDCNANLIPDLCDLAGGIDTDFNHNGILDGCEPNRTHYVAPIECPVDAGTDGPAGTLEDPFCTIQQGINASIPGDTVIALDGIYTGPGNRQINFAGRAITLIGQNGPTGCTLDLDQAGRAFIFVNSEGPDTVVDGFTIINGAATRGGAIFCDDAGPTFANCIIAGNVALVGGGIYCIQGSPLLINCVIVANQASMGGGVYLMSPNARFINCTLADNLAGQGGAIACLATNVWLDNSIVWNNAADEGSAMFAFAAPPASNISVSYCSLQNDPDDWALGQELDLVWTTGNISSDPAFVDGPGGDYRLSPGSPSIDAGDTTAVLPQMLTDVSGRSRLVDDLLSPDTGVARDQDAVVDIGAYELFETALSAVSLQDHNGMELGLDLSNNIESRSGGLQKIRFQTGAPTVNVSASATCVNSPYNGQATAVTSDSDVTITFSPALPDMDCCTIDLTGDLVGAFTVRILHGDINRNGLVTTGDASSIRFFFGKTAEEAGPQYDINQDGVITTGDFGIVRFLFNHQAPACP